MTADYDYLPVKSKLETYGGCSGQLVVQGRVFVRRNGTLRVLILGLLAGVDLVLGGGGTKRSFSLEDLQELLALGIDKDSLDLLDEGTDDFVNGEDLETVLTKR